MKTAIIDYDSGNLFSVFHACKNVGLDPLITQSPNDLDDASLIILPGVGSFGSAMKTLRDKELDEIIIKNTNNGKPLIGICLGMQLLLSSSEELGKNEGLNLIAGRVKSFRKAMEPSARVPHVGWNKVELNQNQKNSILPQTLDGSHMYFVHSFYVETNDPNHSLAYTYYDGLKFSSIIGKDNLLGIQCHPERSGQIGAQLFETIKNI